MKTRVAVMGIIVEKAGRADRLNAALHEYACYIVGRMGVPYRKRGVNVISVVMDAPEDAISALAGKIGNIDGVSVKTAYSSVVSEVA